MIYNIYTDNTGTINMNWIGEYTFGSTFFRGTRIHLQDKCGISLGYVNDYLDNINSISLINDIMFWDDNTIRIDSLDEFINNSNRIELKTITFSDVKTIINDIDIFYDVNHAILFNHLIDHNKLKNDFLSNYDKIKNASKILESFGDGMIFVIYDYNNMINELKEINTIAKANNVTFEWI